MARSLSDLKQQKAKGRSHPVSDLRDKKLNILIWIWLGQHS